MNTRLASRQRPSRTLRGPAGTPSSCLVNDVHSQLNATLAAGIVRPQSVDELCEAVAATAARGQSLSICGRRHAMGGQQFAARTQLLDTTGLNRVLDVDPERGLVTVEAGIDWRTLVDHLLWTFPREEEAWGIIQKQTGADDLTIGGALAANIHGRGLRLRPFIADVESLEIVEASGRLATCSRTLAPRLFSLAIGGYGLFGPVARVTLRLGSRRKLARHVVVAQVENLPGLFEERVRAGYEYGDFQFATDPASNDFLRTGVFSCYLPVPDDTVVPGDQRALSARDWRRLLRLAHADKSRAFAEYASYYLATSGQIYWSDTHQLAYYADGYHEELDRELRSVVKGSEMISELYVPRHLLPEFMDAVRCDARQHELDVIYGTIRIIERDDESALAWARQPWACIVFNLHVDHTAEGLSKAAADCRRLIDRAAALGGSYYLTYHRWAAPHQLLQCHPRIHEFLQEKQMRDPACTFTSDWYSEHLRLAGVQS
jgi:FAD/FMN-containing dehydrogenase